MVVLATLSAALSRVVAVIRLKTTRRGPLVLLPWVAFAPVGILFGLGTFYRRTAPPL